MVRQNSFKISVHFLYISFSVTLIYVIFCVLFSSMVYAQTSEPIKVLIVDGFSNHDWAQTTVVTKWILEESGRFKVDVSTIPADSIKNLSWLPAFKKYAVIIQNTNNVHDTRLRWPREAECELEQFVKRGGGLYILHSANNAFPH